MCSEHIAGRPQGWGQLQHLIFTIQINIVNDVSHVIIFKWYKTSADRWKFNI